MLYFLLTTAAKLLRAGGNKAIIGEHLLLKQQLIIHRRSGQRALNLTTQDRTLLGFWSCIPGA
jgi:putative transposase